MKRKKIIENNNNKNRHKEPTHKQTMIDVRGTRLLSMDMKDLRRNNKINCIQLKFKFAFIIIMRYFCA